MKTEGVDKVWDGTAAKEVSGKLDAVTKDVTLTAMYKLTMVDGDTSNDKINAGTKTDTTGDQTANQDYYVAVGETVTVTPHTGRVATVKPAQTTDPAEPTSGTAFTFVMPAADVTVTFAAE